MTSANANANNPKKQQEQKMKNQTVIDHVGDREIVIARTFNAPPALVFDAYTKPELVARWWAPKSHGVEVVSIDADIRVGGKWRYVLRPQSHPPFAFYGEYTEIVTSKKLVYTSYYEPAADAGATICTITFDEDNGKTHMVSREVYPSAMARTMAISSGMESGVLACMDQLDELAASLR